MPFDPSTGFMGGFLSAEQGFAQLRGQEQLNQMNAIKIQQATENMAVQARTRSAMQAEAARQMALDGAAASIKQGGMGAIGGTTLPTPEDLLAREKEDSDKPASSGDFEKQPFSMGAAAQQPKISDLAMKEYESELGKARAAAVGGDLTLHDKHGKEAAAALQKATAARNEERKEQTELYNNMVQWTTAATDQDSLNNVANLVRAKYGREQADQVLKQIGVPFDGAGNPVWNDRVGKRIDTLRTASMTELDRLRRAEVAAERERKEQHNIAEEREWAEKREDRRRADADRREAREGRADLQREVLEDRRANRADRNTAEVQRSLEKDPIYRDWTKYRMAGDQAKAIVTQLMDPKGFQSFNASDARALATSYQNISEGFRARVGGKYALQDIDKFNGLYQKLDKYVKTIGRGGTALSESTARDLANTITDLSDIANKNATIVSLEGMELAAKKNGHPDQIRFQGDLPRLINIGQARIETNETTGKRTIHIGKGKNVHSFPEYDDKE